MGAGEAGARLDDPREFARLDPSGMLGLVERFPAQASEAIERAGRLRIAEADRRAGADRLLVAGMGGSAAAGEILQGYASSQGAGAVAVHRDEGLPAHAGAGTFVAAVSYSGETAETLSAYEEARRRGLPCVALASGGALAAAARRDGARWVELPEGYPPRAALAFSLFPLLGLAETLGIAAPGAERAEVPAVLAEVADRCGPARPSRDNPAKQLALALEGCLPVIHWGAPALAGVATRLRTQLAENAKVFALSAAYPELAHNEVVAWDGPREAAARTAVVELVEGTEEARLARLRADVGELARGRGGRVVELRAHGRGRLARLLSLVLMGDFTSVYLAFLNGVDPMRIAPIEWLKARSVPGGAPEVGRARP